MGSVTLPGGEMMQSDTSRTALLQVRKLTRRFGGLKAVDDLSLDVFAGTIHGLIGPNGAGKTTTFNLISGFYAPTGGRILYGGRDVTGSRTSTLARAGLVRTFQGATLFHELSVVDNVRVGCHGSAHAGLVSRILGKDGPIERAADREARGILDLFGLGDLAHEPAAKLPHGHQRALGIAVALAADPKLLLLDEPFTGMNGEETRRMMGHVRQLRDERGVTVMLVEHDMRAVMGLCDVITVMNFGRALAEGTPEAVRKDPRVVEAYLGRVDHAA
jgi:branched-chain amino acid transport system ATP-binding protein